MEEAERGNNFFRGLNWGILQKSRTTSAEDPPG